MALSGKGNFKIGSTEYSPSKLKVTYDSLATSNSGRADDGTMVITWVRQNIRKVEITRCRRSPRFFLPYRARSTI